MRTLALAVAGAVMLGACASPAEQAASMQREMDRMIVVYGPACQKLGYAQQTDAWRSCVLQLALKDDVANASSLAVTYYPNYPGRPPHWR